jgi:hypothetical protein
MDQLTFVIIFPELLMIVTVSIAIALLDLLRLKTLSRGEKKLRVRHLQSGDGREVV